jgi:hypothetical protein
MTPYLRVVAAVVLVFAGAVAGAQAPIPVAERFVTHLDRTTRVSLFSNGVAVVTIRSDSEDFQRRTTLALEEYMVYLQALNRYAAEIGEDPVTSDVESGGSTATLTLHVGPDSPRTFSYSPLASMNLSAGKIVSIMDDIQFRVLSTRPGEDEIKLWQPAIGDCVELRHGGTACVTDIAQDGTIVLTQDETSVMYAVAREDRVDIIYRVIEKPQ